MYIEDLCPDVISEIQRYLTNEDLINARVCIPSFRLPVSKIERERRCTEHKNYLRHVPWNVVKRTSLHLFKQWFRFSTHHVNDIIYWIILSDDYSKLEELFNEEPVRDEIPLRVVNPQILFILFNDRAHKLDNVLRILHRINIPNWQRMIDTMLLELMKQMPRLALVAALVEYGANLNYHVEIMRRAKDLQFVEPHIYEYMINMGGVVIEDENPPLLYKNTFHDHFN